MASRRLRNAVGLDPDRVISAALDAALGDAETRPKRPRPGRMLVAGAGVAAAAALGQRRMPRLVAVPLRMGLHRLGEMTHADELADALRDRLAAREDDEYDDLDAEDDDELLDDEPVDDDQDLPDDEDDEDFDDDDGFDDDPHDEGDPPEAGDGDEPEADPDDDVEEEPPADELPEEDETDDAQDDDEEELGGEDDDEEIAARSVRVDPVRAARSVRVDPARLPPEPGDGHSRGARRSRSERSKPAAAHA